ncbi:MAG: hypothetical protein ACD_16C00234G0006 [uncultured bacterium]|nr:MAG: hypothetical protein ACD_16C00234G0006 [uncultured bacterium]OFW69979.1 MAG: hypothetical protein A2X70_00195 [Alphaproteobacteria bacterium GWC2_42_16]OFW74457.1 MAG: hypothetical protein A2Z80_05460 [Alphaproteobacteria bacterium GWA2_41_27]OFW84811.1 MAG: hypothetical protein A3E50_00920 [Alphaproteobacteria bacterium RIFCSPHIGHO2_12_FULL_42_100]OFW86674.1 MAG: hypothetical protein A2W06_04700 [Alphaproteobacteria bacterium RBG_16_42_14]OFW90686.1 MAG: hypothetical protein A3C41_047
MRQLALLSLFFSWDAFAIAPECPLYPNKHVCLLSVEENYKNFLEFIDEEYLDPKEEIIEAANDIKHFESLACHKTCLN